MSDDTRYFHVSPEFFSPGDVKRKGSFGALLRSDPTYVAEDPDGEFLRESVRANRYPDKPRRLESSFVFVSLADAQTFRDRRGKNEKIYIVAFASEPPSVHRVCYTAWNMSHPSLMVQAEEFWSSKLIYATDTELFAEVDLVIIGEA